MLGDGGMEKIIVNLIKKMNIYWHIDELISKWDEEKIEACKTSLESNISCYKNLLEQTLSATAEKQVIKYIDDNEKVLEYINTFNEK